MGVLVASLDANNIQRVKRVNKTEEGFEVVEGIFSLNGGKSLFPVRSITDPLYDTLLKAV